MKRFARGVEIDGYAFAVDMKVDSQVGIIEFDRGSSAPPLTNSEIDDRVFGDLRRVERIGEDRAAGDGIDRQRARRRGA